MQLFNDYSSSLVQNLVTQQSYARLAWLFQWTTTFMFKVHVLKKQKEDNNNNDNNNNKLIIIIIIILILIIIIIISKLVKENFILFVSTMFY